MDDFTSFINFQEDDALLLQHNATFPCRQPTIQQDLAIPGALLAPVLDGNDPTIAKKGKKQRKSSAIIRDSGDGSAEDNNQKKEVHRDIERQRRQEMAKLYASLRNLLPLEYIKGKRSISDQVNEAVNYIKYLENNIKDQELKRDNLRHLLDASDVNFNAGSSRNSLSIEFTVRSCSENGIGILISHDAVEERFPLSCLLKLLLEEGLTVVSCFYTKVNGNFLYTIQSEASHLTGVDLCVLPQKLTQKINTWIKFKNWRST